MILPTKIITNPHRIIMGVFFMLSTLDSPAQSSNDDDYFTEVLRTTKNFYEIEKKVEQYYRNKDKGKGSGYKQWKRWQYFYKKRLMPDGTVPNLGAIEMQELDKTRLVKITSKSSQTTANWTNVNLDSYVRFGSGYNGGIGRVNCIVVDPDDSNIIYVGTPAGGLWRSTSGGNSWEPLTDNLPSIGISGIAIDYDSPANNRTIYILTGDGDGSHTRSIGVMKSTDNGRTWEKTGLIWGMQDNIFGYKLVMHPTNSDILMVAARNGIYRTTDGAKTWEQVNDNFLVYDIEFKPGQPSHIYAAGSGEFLQSTNAGKDWISTLGKKGLPFSSSRTSIAVTPDEPNYIYMIFGGVSTSGKIEGVYRSTDSGESFTLQSDTPNILGYERFGGDDRSQSMYDLAIAVSPTNANEVHVGGINCWKSLNGGSTWENTSYWRENLVTSKEYTHADIHALEYLDNVLFVGSDGGIYKTDNGADSWESISDGLNISQPYKIGLDLINPNRFVVGTQDNGSNKYEDGTYFHWFGADGFETIIDPSNPQRIYGSFQYGGLNRSDDNGASFIRITPQHSNGDVVRGDWNTPYLLDPENSNIIYAGYRDVYKSTNQGATWANITNEKIGFSNCEHLTIAPSNNNYLYIIKGTQLYYSHDAGASWKNTEISSNLSLTHIVVHPGTPKTIWVTAGNFSEGKKVYKSIDGGATYTNVSAGLPNIPVNCITYEKGNDDALYIGTDIGVFYKNNRMSDWERYSDNLPNTMVTELEIQYVSRKLYAATFGRGVWVSDLRKPATSISNCVASTINSWINTAIDNQTNNFEAIFSVTPNGTNVNGVVGLSNNGATSYNDMGMIIRFNKTGAIDVRNGANYASVIPVNYSVGDRFEFRVAVDFENKKYSVYTSKNEGEELLIADQFNFRTQQASLANVNNWATFSGDGILNVCDFSISREPINENKLPTVVMTSPANNTTFEEGDTITLSSDATDPDGSVVRVTWFRNNIRIRSDSGNPYSKPWENVPAGIYEITATAQDDTGAIVTSEPVSIRVVKSICEITTEQWSGISVNPQEGSFSTRFMVTPNQNNMDGVVGLSNGVSNSYADLAAILRLNKKGEFDVRNGGNYDQSATLEYTKGTKYEVRFEVNVKDKKYSVYIKPANGGTEVKVANNFDFRTDQATVSSLNYCSWLSGVGSHEVCVETINNTALSIENQDFAEYSITHFNEKNVENNSTLSIFPNPSSGRVSFLLTNTVTNDMDITIYDFYGKIVRSVPKKLNQNEIIVDISSLKNGVYIVQVPTGNTLLTKKMVVFN